LINAESEYPRYNSLEITQTESRIILHLKPLIQVDHLTYRHPGTAEAAAPALLDVSLRIEEGEMVALVGANGSGKTTLARHLNALLLPTSGEVRINGMDTRDADSHPQIRANVGMVFQHPEDQIVATIVEEDIAFGPENLCHLPPVIREEVDQALKIVGMSEQRRRQPHLLSAGQMQRVAAGRSAGNATTLHHLR